MNLKKKALELLDGTNMQKVIESLYAISLAYPNAKEEATAEEAQDIKPLRLPQLSRPEYLTQRGRNRLRMSQVEMEEGPGLGPPARVRQKKVKKERGRIPFEKAGANSRLLDNAKIVAITPLENKSVKKEPEKPILKKEPSTNQLAKENSYSTLTTSTKTLFKLSKLDLKQSFTDSWHEEDDDWEDDWKVTPAAATNASAKRLFPQFDSVKHVDVPKGSLNQESGARNVPDILKSHKNLPPVSSQSSEKPSSSNRSVNKNIDDTWSDEDDWGSPPDVAPIAIKQKSFAKPSATSNNNNQSSHLKFDVSSKQLSQHRSSSSRLPKQSSGPVLVDSQYGFYYEDKLSNGLFPFPFPLSPCHPLSPLSFLSPTFPLPFLISFSFPLPSLFPSPYSFPFPPSLLLPFLCHSLSPSLLSFSFPLRFVFVFFSIIVTSTVSH